MGILDSTRLFLANIGLIQSGDRQHVVTLNAAEVPLDESDVNRLLGKRKVPELVTTLEDEYGNTLIDDGWDVEIGLDRTTWLSEAHRMRQDDAVRDGLNIIFGLLRNMSYYVIPASDSTADVKVAAFVADQLGIGRVPFIKYPTFRKLLTLYELALIYGYSAGELVFTKEGTTAHLDKIVGIHPFNIADIERDNKGGPKRLVVSGVRRAGENQTGKQVDVKVPFSKLVYFSVEDDGSLFGVGLLRAAYVPWRIKRAMLRLVNAGYERFLLGIPVMKVPKSVMPNTQEWNMAVETLTKIAAKPRSGAVLPDGWELEIRVVNTQMPDALPYIVRQDLAIKRAMGVSYAALGSDVAGANYKQTEQLSKATYLFVMDLTKQFIEYINLYVVNKLVYLNYPTLKRYPYVGLIRSSNADASSVLNAFAQMVSASTGQNGFDPEKYQQIVDNAPILIREMLGFEEDALVRAVEKFRRSVR